MSKYESYNEMLNDLYNQHTHDDQINIRIEYYEKLSDIKIKAVNHFVNKLRLQGWIIHVDECVYAEEQIVNWKEDKHHLYIYGQLKSKL